MRITKIKTTSPGKPLGYVAEIGQWVAVRVSDTGRGFVALIDGAWRNCVIDC